jgi:hypothetical protein
VTGELHATRDALDWLPPFPASDVVNQARSAALAEVEHAEKVIEAAKKVWECHEHTEWCELSLGVDNALCDCGISGLQGALQALAALDAAKGKTT